MIAAKSIPRTLQLLVLLVSTLVAGQAMAAKAVRIPIADGFDFPVGKADAKSGANAEGYYKARGLRLRAPTHFGEDWNGRGGGNSDLGDKVYSTANGIVVWAYDVRGGWGNVVIVRHAYRDPKSGQVKYCDSLYGHLNRMMVKVGQQMKRGEQIGTIGTNRGMYAAHLHFEIRHNIYIGMHRSSVQSNYTNWADPTAFINRYRRLNREWGKQSVPIGTCPEYKGFRGL